MQPEQSAVIRHKVNDDKIFIYYSLASEITGSILAALQGWEIPEDYADWVEQKCSNSSLCHEYIVANIPIRQSVKSAPVMAYDSAIPRCATNQANQYGLNNKLLHNIAASAPTAIRTPIS